MYQPAIFGIFNIHQYGVGLRHRVPKSIRHFKPVTMFFFFESPFSFGEHLS